MASNLFPSRICTIKDWKLKYKIAMSIQRKEIPASTLEAIWHKTGKNLWEMELENIASRRKWEWGRNKEGLEACFPENNIQIAKLILPKKKIQWMLYISEAETSEPYKLSFWGKDLYFCDPIASNGLYTTVKLCSWVTVILGVCHVEFFSQFPSWLFCSQLCGLSKVAF